MGLLLSATVFFSFVVHAVNADALAITLWDDSSNNRILIAWEGSIDNLNGLTEVGQDGRPGNGGIWTVSPSLVFLQTPSSELLHIYTGSIKTVEGAIPLPDEVNYLNRANLLNGTSPPSVGLWGSSLLLSRSDYELGGPISALFEIPGETLKASAFTGDATVTHTWDNGNQEVSAVFVVPTPEPSMAPSVTSVPSVSPSTIPPSMAPSDSLMPSSGPTMAPTSTPGNCVSEFGCGIKGDGSWMHRERRLGRCVKRCVMPSLVKLHQRLGWECDRCV